MENREPLRAAPCEWFLPRLLFGLCHKVLCGIEHWGGSLGTRLRRTFSHLDMSHSVCPCVAVSYKKRVLLRWQESGGNDHEPPPSSAEAPPPTISSPQAAQDQGESPAPPTSTEAQEEAKDNAQIGGNVFDYFDDFSDGEEFELVGRERHGLDEPTAEGGKTREGPHTPPGEEEEEKSVPHPPRLEKQNSSLSIISDTSLQSSDGEMEEKEEEGKEREEGPPPPQAISPATNISDVSIDLDQSGTKEDALPKLEQPAMEVESHLPTKLSHEVVTPSAAKDQSEMNLEAPSSSPLPQESRVLDLVPKEKEEKEPGEAREAEGKEKDGGARIDEEPSEGTGGEGPVELLEPPRPLVSQEETTGSPEKTSGLPKTPGKRKVSASAEQSFVPHVYFLPLPLPSCRSIFQSIVTGLGSQLNADHPLRNPHLPTAVSLLLPCSLLSSLPLLPCLAAATRAH